MNMKYILAISLTANIALIIYTSGFLTKENPISPTESWDKTLSNAKKYPLKTLSSYNIEDLKSYVEQLMDQGLTIDQTKPIILAELKNIFIHSINKPIDDFWVNNPTYQADYLEDLTSGYSKLRKKIVDLYGKESISDTVFSDIFYPLQSQYSSLGSSEQIKIQESQIQVQKSYIKSQSRHASNSRGLNIESSPQKILERSLDKSTLREYQLRNSPLSNKMRLSGLEFTENTFRSAFDTLYRMQNSGNATEASKARKKIFSIFGKESGLLLWSSIDPEFSLIKAIVTKQNANEDQVMLVYDVINSSKSELQEIAINHKDDPQGSFRVIQDVIQRRNEALETYLGTEGLKSFNRAINSARSSQNLLRKPQ